MILAASFLENSRTYLDYRNGKLGKGFWLNQMNTISEKLKKPLTGSYAFTVNDYVSPFFRKGKKMCPKTMEKSQNFVDVFSRLAKNCIIYTNDIVIATLEKYLCPIYG